MGTSTAAHVWPKVVKLLQDCSTMQIDSGEADATLTSMYDLINRQDEAPTPPKAVLKKLVRQLQVRES